MKTTFFLLVLALFVSAGFGQGAEINIIPKPTFAENISATHGSFEMTPDTPLYISGNKDEKVLVTRFNDFISSHYGFKLKTKKWKPGETKGIFLFGKISFRGKPIQYMRGGYDLHIERGFIAITASDNAGRSYALQSLYQLFPTNADQIKIPAVRIKDEPRFPYRGMHLDVARHFMPVEFVKKYIDLMSQYKFNYFHWHLTEDQGWRIEIKKYPRLTEIGSMRPETVKERNLTPYIGDGIPHAGFYTQEQIKDVVNYAKERHITVIPEIELPGHASAALAAYPQFGCKQDHEYKVQTTWGIFKEVYCPTDETFKFLEDVLEETISLFPDSPYIHIGGDEVLKDHWKESAFVQELMKRENLKDEHEVQSYFIRRIEKFINSKGKKMIGWDEILEGGLAPNATVMSWRGMKGGIEAAKSKHDVIMTPTDFVYFDYGQGDPAYEPLNIGSYVPLEKVYSFEPVPPELTPDEAKYIIGGQANVWTEYMKTPQHVEYMAFPRMLALSEVLWSKKEDRDFADFQRRLNAHLPRLDKQNVNYRIPEPGGLQNIVTEKEKVSVELHPAPGTRVHYTTDGSTPDENSPVYSKPFDIALVGDEVKTLKTIVENGVGRRSAVYAATIMRGRLKDPLQITQFTPGVRYRIDTANHVEPEFHEWGETRTISVQQFSNKLSPKSPFSVEFNGFFRAPVDGIYEFQIESGGGGVLYYGATQKLIEFYLGQRPSSALMPLKAGFHPLRLQYLHHGGEINFRFRWGIKGQGLRQAYGGEFVH